MLVWLDTTTNLLEGHTSWLSAPLGTEQWKISILPTVQPRPGSPLVPVSRLLVHSSSTSNRSLTQALSLLHLDYGLCLDSLLASRDPFYALSELFSVIACSENQFLNMLDDILRDELDADKLASHRNPTLSNLLYNSQTLDRHIEYIRNSLRIITSATWNSWSNYDFDSELLLKLKTTKESLVLDYEHLLSRCLFLSEKWNKGMQIVMNNTMILESEKAIAQAERVQKLTRLAFIFIPLSFTATFFGMNFSQFGQGNLSIWIWFAISVPIFIISVFLMRDDALRFI